MKNQHMACAALESSRRMRATSRAELRCSGKFLNGLALFVLLALAAMPLQAQRKTPNINTETPEGALLQKIGQEGDEKAKLGLMEQFTSQHAKSESAGWVLGQMQPIYLKNQQYDKAIEAGEKILAADPSDTEIAHNCLKAAEAKKDSALIVKWSDATSAAARKTVSSPKPKDEEEAAAWQKQVDYAKQLDTYTEYVLYAQALQTTDPKQRLDLFIKLEARNPQSQYLANTEPQIFQLLMQTGDKEKAIALGEKILQKDASNDDILLVVASHYYEGNKDKAKALQYAQKLADVAPTKTKPEGMSDDDFNNRKTLKVGLGNWMVGVINSNDSKWADADKALRVALPNLKNNNDLMAETLFHLGLANFRLGEGKTPNKQRILDALRYSQQCSALKSRFQAPAAKNVAAIKSQYHIQ